MEGSTPTVMGSWLLEIAMESRCIHKYLHARILVVDA